MYQLDFYEFLSDIRLEDVFKAYFDCRKNKRRSASALRFEMDYERLVINLWEDIKLRKYRTASSNAFIIHKPVLREIFAADFRDRIVHHLVIGKLMRIFEDLFFERSFSCRQGKGTLYGVKQVNSMIQRCSNYYQTDCYVLRLDIQGFFFHIDKNRLYAKLKHLIDCRYHAADKSSLLFLVHAIVFDNPQDHCQVQGAREGWDALPKTKSLFYARKNCGLPIGNLTSQVFANFYLNEMDHYIQSLDSQLFYGRYVDDMVLVHPDKGVLMGILDKLRQYMRSNLGLKLHPRKVVLQHYAKGCAFTGAFIKPGRMYPSRRFKEAFYGKVNQINLWWSEHPSGQVNEKLIEASLSRMNSYLGLLKHFNSWRLRLNAWNALSQQVRDVFDITPDLTKIYVRAEVKIKMEAKRRERFSSPDCKRNKRKKHGSAFFC